MRSIPVLNILILAMGLILGGALVADPMFASSIKKIKLPSPSFKGELSVEEAINPELISGIPDPLGSPGHH